MNFILPAGRVATLQLEEHHAGQSLRSGEIEGTIDSLPFPLTRLGLSVFQRANKFYFRRPTDGHECSPLTSLHLPVFALDYGLEEAGGFFSGLGIGREMPTLRRKYPKPLRSFSITLIQTHPSPQLLPQAVLLTWPPGLSRPQSQPESHPRVESPTPPEAGAYRHWPVVGSPARSPCRSAGSCRRAFP